MAKLKTQQTDSSVTAYIEAIDDEQRRLDCIALADIMRRVTREEPKMGGPAIVGFGRYHYQYDSGHEGDMCVVGFSSRKAQISIYILSGFESRARLLAALGKHKTAKACLSIKRLSDIKIEVLQSLIAESVAVRRKLDKR